VRLSRLIQEGRLAKDQLARTGQWCSQAGTVAGGPGGRCRHGAVHNSNLRLVVSLAKRYQASDLPLLTW